MEPAIALFELKASLPPFNITALPDLRQRTAASAVTLGRASYIIAITPRGTLICSIFIPFPLVYPDKTLPTGSGRLTTSRTEDAIELIRSFVSARRSSIASLIPFSFAFCKSRALAFRIISVFSISFSDILLSARSFSPVFFFAAETEAFFAFEPILLRYSFI